MTKILNSIAKILIIIFLPLILLLTLLQVYTFNADFYIEEFEKYDVEQVTKMNKDDLRRVTNKIISYLQDKEENLNITAEINGNEEEVFGKREKNHMVDVKLLFLLGYKIRNFGIIITILSITYLYYFSSNKKRDIWKSIYYSSIVPIVFIVLLFILVQIDFYKYFTYFHEIFFTNDLWLLNPKTDILIQMLPLGFFMDITKAVLIWLLGISAAMGILSYIKLKSLKSI